MRIKSIDVNWQLVSVAVLGALVTACGNRASAPTPELTQAAPPVSSPEPVAQPEAAPEASPVVVATAPAPAAGTEPDVAGMKVAQVVSDKTGVPVELRYQFDGDAMAGGPVTLHLAAVPRVAGTNLAVSIKQESGIDLPRNELHAAKVDVATPYRQQLQLTRKAGGPQEIRVLVTMDFPIGQGFTWYTVPLAGSAVPGK